VAGRILSRIVLVLIGILVGALGWPTGLAAQTTDEVESLRVHVEVARNGSIRVTERIRVRSETVFRHGLVRYYATTRRRPDGLGWMQLPFRLGSVTLDGTPTTFRETAAGGPFGRSGLRVRAGGPVRLVGEHTFKLVYETERRVDYGPVEDVLVWDVTGSGWGVPIREASVVLTVEGLSTSPAVTARVGPRAGAGEPVAAAWDPATGATATMPRPLNPGESFSIGLRLPKWSIAAVPYHVEREWFWLDWRDWIEAGWALGVVAALYLLMWIRVGRDPSETLVVEIAPPAGLSAAAIGYLHARRWHPRLYAAALVSLATRGAVRVVRSAGGWTVERGEARGGLPADERVVLREVLGAEKAVPLRVESAERLALGAEALRRSLSTTLERAFFLQNRRWFLAGLGVSVASLLALAWRWRFDIEAGSTAVAVFLTLWTLATVSLAVRAVAFVAHARAGGGRIGYAWGAVSVIAFVPLAVSNTAIAWGVLRMVPLHIVAAGLAIGVTNAAFYHLLLLERPTVGGSRLLARVEGFRHFLETVDADRLARLGAQADPTTFDRYLPHAIALGVEHAWARRFRALLSPPGAVGAVRNPPSAWCVAPAGEAPEDPAGLAKELTEALGEAHAATLRSSA
jgi:Predicted membrane protein (DUF2207) C-terminal domain/Predicted membrane protein (DUF2207) N-terminal domain